MSIFNQALSIQDTPGYTRLTKSCNPQIKQIKVQTINGSVYDPTIGQFLSPDNYVQLPDASLGFNRYSYALNNPLVYTDPDGENPIFLLFIGMTLFTGGHVIHDQVVAGNLSPYWNQWSNVMVGGGTMMMGMGMGAAAGLAAPAFAESFFGGAAYYGGTTYFSSYTFNMIFNDMSRSEAAKYAALSSILPAIRGGLKGGLTALGQDENFWWGTPAENWGYNKSQWSLLPWFDKADVYTFQADYPNIVNINNFRCDGTSFSSTHGNTNEYWQSKLDARGRYEPYTKVYASEGLDYQIGGNMEDISNYYSQGHDKLHLRVTDYGPSGDYHRMAVKKIRHVPGKKLIIKVYDPGAGVMMINKGSPNFSKSYNIYKGVNFRFNEFVLFR